MRALSLFLAIFLYWAGQVALATPAIIPQPQELELRQGQFVLDAEAVLVADTVLVPTASFLALALAPATGHVLALGKDESEGKIALRLDRKLGAESYKLAVSPTGVLILGGDAAGVFYGVQTLLQLLPAAIYSRAVQPDAEWIIPAVEISDSPRFRWRGMHLDVGRHFMPLAFIKKFIDLLAIHKFNIFHWHLTEDQGWRIEVQRYPKLTGIGSQRAQTVVGNMLFADKDELAYDGVPHGGFYTQDEIREVVAYAAERYINVVPEIEFPGHAQAAIAAYPELGNTGEQLRVKEEWGISEHTVKPSEETLEFYRNVLLEVMELFPSEYIHIGGDEALKDEWEASPYARQRMEDLGLKDARELQSWLIGQMDEFLTAHGRRLVGWDEIMQGGLSPNATVMSWRGIKPGLRAAEAGHDVIMAPTRWTYFDYYQADEKIEPLAIGFYLPLREVYAFDPAPADWPAEVRARILGAQGQLWTEYMKTPEHVEYMTYPRASALAEVLWTEQSNRDYEDFQRRLQIHADRLRQLEINYRPLGDDELSLPSRIEHFLWNVGIEFYHWWHDL